MRHEEFRIGTEFWCGGRRWRCTDVGTRVVVAICLDPHEVVTLVRDADTHVLTETRAITTDESWFSGPPYAVPEEIFDEHSTQDCTLSPRADDHSFRISFVSSAADQPVPPVAEVLARLRSVPPWDEASIARTDDPFPRAHAQWHDRHGFVIQCFEHDQSVGHFLARNAHVSSPAVEINLGGQTLERWPPELFVPEPLAHQALEHFLNAGRRDPTLHWLGTGDFPREVVWNGRAEREARERENRTTRRDENETE